MPNLPVSLHAAFAAAPLGGNIGGVVYEDEPLSAECRQRIAADLAAPTTGFVTENEDGSFHVRYHSSLREMDMCGHVTVAIFAAMFEDERITEGRYEQHTRAGIIPVEVDSGGKIWMSQPLPRFDLNAVSVAEAAPLLGLESKAIIDVASASSALRHVFVEVPDEQTLARLRPDDEGLRGLSASRGIDTIGVWCWQSGGQGRLRVRLRDLCHGVGDPEEAASGTTNGALACHIHRAGRIDAATNGEVRMIGEQGFEMGRASRVETILTEHSGNIASVRVGGHAEARLKGQYFLK